MFWFYSDHERRRYQKVPVLILSKSATMYRIEALEDINAPTLSLKKGKRSQVDKKYINLSNNEMEA